MAGSACGAGNATYRNTVLADNPWGYWRLTDTSGTVATDCSINGTRNAAYVGTFALGVTQQGWAGAAAPVAAQLDGSTSYIRLPTIPASKDGGPLFGAGFSLEMWMYSAYPTGLTSQRFLFDLGNGWAGGSVPSDIIFTSLNSATANTLYSQIIFGNYVAAPGTYPTYLSLSPYNWHHIVSTFTFVPATSTSGAILSLANYFDGKMNSLFGLVMLKKRSVSDALKFPPTSSASHPPVALRPSRGR